MAVVGMQLSRPQLSSIATLMEVGRLEWGECVVIRGVLMSCTYRDITMRNCFNKTSGPFTCNLLTFTLPFQLERATS